MVKIEEIKKLREKTQASVMECRNALEEAEGDMKKAEAILQKIAAKQAEKKKDRETAEGRVEAYVHNTGKVGCLVKLLCETDFVAKTKEFVELGHEIALQVSAMKPENVAELLKQPYIRDPKKTIDDLLKEAVGKLGENIKIGSFSIEEI